MNRQYNNKLLKFYSQWSQNFQKRNLSLNSFLLIIIIFIGVFVYSLYRINNLSNGAFTVGEVYDFWRDGRSNPVTCFEYYYQGVRYTGSSAVVINDGKKGKGNKYLIKFSTKKPKVNLSLGLRYNLPDSLELGTLIVYDFERKKIVNIDTTHVVREKLN